MSPSADTPTLKRMWPLLTIAALTLALVLTTLLAFKAERELQGHLDFHRCDTRLQHEAILRGVGVDPPPRPDDMPDCPAVPSG